MEEERKSMLCVRVVKTYTRYFPDFYMEGETLPELSKGDRIIGEYSGIDNISMKEIHNLCQETTHEKLSESDLIDKLDELGEKK